MEKKKIYRVYVKNEVHIVRKNGFFKKTKEIKQVKILLEKYVLANSYQELVDEYDKYKKCVQIKNDEYMRSLVCAYLDHGEKIDTDFSECNCSYEIVQLENCTCNELWGSLNYKDFMLLVRQELFPNVKN